MAKTFDEWVRTDNPWKVIEAAQECDTALDAAVVRIIDTLLDLQLVRRHDGVGYQPFSVTGNVPMPGSGKAIDQCMIAAERYHPDSQWHKACGWLMDQLPKRQAAAMMLQAARVRPGKVGTCKFSVTASQMVEQQNTLLMYLGMRDYAVKPFESVRAMQECGSRARQHLREWLKAGSQLDKARG